MSVIYLLLPLSLCLGGGALLLFIYGLKTGQFEDLETPAYRILYDEDQEQ